MNIRKKCIDCDLIAFATDEVCKRCGSDNLDKVPMSEDLLFEQITITKKALPFWVYLVCFILSCIFEFVALLPVLANIGWRHSSRAPKSEFEINSEFAAFMLHLPTSAFAYIFSYLDGGLLLLLTPFLQIIFWTFILIKLWRKMDQIFGNTYK